MIGSNDSKELMFPIANGESEMTEYQQMLAFYGSMYSY